MAEVFLVKLPSEECLWVLSLVNCPKKIALDLIDDKSTLVQVMAWCYQATSHYQSQCWPISMSPSGITRPQWVNHLLELLVPNLHKFSKLLRSKKYCKCFDLQVAISLSVERDWADGCHDDSHTQCHRYKEHNDMFGTIFHHFFLLLIFRHRAISLRTCSLGRATGTLHLEKVEQFNPFNMISSTQVLKLRNE